MSNHPRVYGFCDAGCKRRVPTYEEFLQSASMVKMNATDKDFAFEFGKKYRIAKTEKNATQWGFEIFVEFSYAYLSAKGVQTMESTQYVELPECTRYSEYFTFRYIDIYSQQRNNESWSMFIAYEINGEIKTQELDWVVDIDPADYLLEMNRIGFSFNSQVHDCYLINEGTEIALKIIEEAETVAEINNRIARMESFIGNLFSYCTIIFDCSDWSDALTIEYTNYKGELISVGKGNLNRGNLVIDDVRQGSTLLVSSNSVVIKFYDTYDIPNIVNGESSLNVTIKAPDVVGVHRYKLRGD